MSSTKQVLIIEDNSICQDIYKLIFRRLNCPIVIAGTATEGFALAKAFYYNCILSDWNLPDCNDHLLIETIRNTRLNSATPIYVISAHPSEEIAKACQPFSVQGVYTKPIKAGMVEELVLPYIGE